MLYVKNIGECWPTPSTFRRGTQISLVSKILSARVLEASRYRRVLIDSRKDFLKQLSTINQSIWNYEQHRVTVAAPFDKKIVEVNKLNFLFGQS